ncbi:MAG: hypothetical protein RI949_1133 [Pseudomonadota bacterium]
MLSFVRRWGVYLAIAFLVPTLGATNALMAMLAWSVTPLFQAAHHAVLDACLVGLGYVMLQSLFILVLSPLLWPRAWSEAERSLPIDENLRRRSDLHVVLMGLSPPVTAQALGILIWLVKFPVWIQESWGVGVSIWGVSMVLSVALGMLMLGLRRRLPTPAIGSLRDPWRSRSPAHGWRQRQPISAFMALLLWPMVRGPARRAGRIYALTVLALCVCITGLIMTPQRGSWWLAAFAITAQALVTRLSAVLEAALQPLHQACGLLPLDPDQLRRHLRLCVMSPLVAGQLMLLAAIAGMDIPVKPVFLTLYLLTNLLGTLALVAATSAPPRVGLKEDPQARASWWLLVLVITIALASEAVA